MSEHDEDIAKVLGMKVGESVFLVRLNTNVTRKFGSLKGICFDHRSDEPVHYWELSCAWGTTAIKAFYTDGSALATKLKEQLELSQLGPVNEWGKVVESYSVAGWIYANGVKGEFKFNFDSARKAEAEDLQRYLTDELFCKHHMALEDVAIYEKYTDGTNHKIGSELVFGG